MAGASTRILKFESMSLAKSGWVWSLSGQCQYMFGWHSSCVPLPLAKYSIAASAVQETVLHVAS